MSNSIIEDYVESKPHTRKPEAEAKAEAELSDIEVKRESLAILASLGSTKEYLGDHLNLGDTHKLKTKEVEKYYNRYQVVLGKQVSNGLIESFIRTAVKGISYLLPIDDPEGLREDLQGDELVKRELSNLSGQLVLRGGRLVALGSAMFHVVRHVDFSPANLADASPGFTRRSARTFGPAAGVRPKAQAPKPISGDEAVTPSA